MTGLLILFTTASAKNAHQYDKLSYFDDFAEFNPNLYKFMQSPLDMLKGITLHIVSRPQWHYLSLTNLKQTAVTLIVYTNHKQTEVTLIIYKNLKQTEVTLIIYKNHKQTGVTLIIYKNLKQTAVKLIIYTNFQQTGVTLIIFKSLKQTAVTLIIFKNLKQTRVTLKMLTSVYTPWSLEKQPAVMVLKLSTWLMHAHPILVSILARIL